MQLASQKRRGSAPDAPSTRDRLKAAARSLFAERGIEGTTVRDILTVAGEKNGASLNYYFRSKEELIRELTVDVFRLMDDRWNAQLAELDRQGRPLDIRDYVRILVTSSDTSDVEDEPTTARLSEAITHHRYHLVREILKEHRLNDYDVILGRIDALMEDMPRPILRQRLLLLTRYLSSEKLDPHQNIWVRTTGPVPQDRRLQMAVLAYLSDMTLLDTSLFAHGTSVLDRSLQVASLDHAMWFHRPPVLDDWLLYSQDSPSASGARGMTRGAIFTRDGTLIASVAQEGLIRKRATD